jgi:hypothetical protein
MKRYSKGNIRTNGRIVRVVNGYAKEYYDKRGEFIDMMNGSVIWYGDDNSVYKPNFNEYDKDMVKRHKARKNRDIKKEVMFYD